MVDTVKKRKIRKTDWEKVQAFIKKELQYRKDNPFRKAHETIWKEVDRQISMEPMKKYYPNGKEIPPSWNSAFELGELSKASEVITADTMRLIFPSSRSWMEPHVKPPVKLDPQSGKTLPVDPNKQKKVDGLMKALMTQQHIDFGLKERIELSIKEALHHGSFVATVEDEELNKIYDGQGVVSMNAAVWKPHSMWNCYPDMSPSVVPGSIFYPGSMLIVSYMPRYKVLALTGDGYMNLSDEKLPKTKNTNKDVQTDDVELVTYYGDLTIEREDGDIFLPNSKCMTGNGTVIYYLANPLPFPEVIYQGYERQDVRDPYFTSPIVKNSPMQKLATLLANEFIDGVRLHTSPPGVYDGNDAYLVQTGGPQIWPGAMTPSKGSNKVTFMTVGDPKATLEGLQLALLKLEEGTSVNAIRSGGRESDRKTATEVNRTSQGAEVRTVDFVDKLERGGLRPFLYMQHELNLKKMKSYNFYCPEKGLPDFIEIKKDQLPKIVHFEVVGSKGILGEQERAQRAAAVTAFASENPLFAPLLNAPDILKDMYEDAGVKSAETYIKSGTPQIPPQVQMQMQQLQQALQECQQELQAAKSGVEVKMKELELKAREAQADNAIKQSELQLKKAEAAASQQNDRAEVMAKIDLGMQELALERDRINKELALETARIRADYEAKMKQLEAENDRKQQETEAKIEAVRIQAKAKAKAVNMERTAKGYRMTED